MPPFSFVTVSVLLSSVLFSHDPTRLFTQEPSRLVAASNVRLRAAPLETAEMVATVPLGALAVELESGGEGGA